MIKLGEIVITGYGIKAPGVHNKTNLLDVLRNGKCTQSIIHNNTLPKTSIVAGVIEDYFIEINGKNYKRYPRFTRMAVAAALDAATMSNLHYYKPHRIGVIIGTAAGAILEIEQYSSQFFDLKTTPLHGVAFADSHTVSNSVSELIGSCGPSFTISTGCTASLDTVSIGKLLLESGDIDACIVGGTEAPLGQWTMNGFNKIRSLSTESVIEKAGVPFSSEHSGFVLSEGAGLLVLERKQNAIERGQKIYGVIERVVSRNEGQSLLKSDITGKHMLEVFQDSLQDTKPTYINSQALGLKANDQIERFILTETFGSEVPISSIKGMLGHSFGAMGAIQIISSLLSMEYGFIPPTIKTNGVGFEDVPIVLETRYQDVESVCITTHGSSGNNACLLLTNSLEAK